MDDFAVQEALAVRVAAGEVEQINPCEDDKETAEERDCVDSVGGVEALEEEERGTENGCGESHVV